MGLVIVLLPADFPAHPHPVWRFYDALPDPLGWALVLTGVLALRRTTALALDAVTWLGVLALVVSVPLWLPQVNHLLVPAYNPHTDVSGQWFVSLPQTLFGFALARAVSRAGQQARPRDTYLAGRFGVLSWGFAACAVLPVIAYGAPLDPLVTPTELLVGLVQVAFCYYLFAAHRRELLGGPGPRDWTAVARGEASSRPSRGSRRSRGSETTTEPPPEGDGSAR